MAVDRTDISLLIDNEAGTGGAPNSKKKPKIQKVHFMLGNKGILREFFEPKVVSFGPIHHRKKEEYEVAEAYKEVWMSEFLKNTCQEKEVLLRRIKEDMQCLRSCFDDDVLKNDKNDDEALARMLLLDGCAVLHFIYGYTDKKLSRELGIQPHIFLSAYHDMFLIENQLPFRLLGLLISPNEDVYKSWKKRIKDFIIDREQPKVPEENQEIKELSIDAAADEVEKLPTHLLELLRESRLKKDEENEEDKKEMDELRLDAEHRKFFGGKDKKTVGKVSLFRSAKELKEFGIKFKSKDTNYLNDITFSEGWMSGYLNIPYVTITDLTGPIFVNFVAYEMCPDFPNDSEFISYIRFLDTLIDTPEDVKVLRQAQVLKNTLTSDEHLAGHFNEIAKGLIHTNPRLFQLKTKIQKHCDTWWRTWWARFSAEHFTYPWSITAFIATLVIFAVQV